MDEPLYQNTHHQAWAYTKKLLLDILLALPATHRVGTVEGLLLLADWIPYIVTESAPGRRNFIEDNTAWSLVGQAVRHAYLLRLDRSSFQDHIAEGPMEEASRRRLAWIFVYLADRQISVRMGQSFWSRGPSLSSRLSLEGFAALRPQSTADEDYPSILLATVELTQILHNAHDILYSSEYQTANMIRRGDYSRCLDDFSKSLRLWHESWSALAVSPKLRSTLLLMYEYLTVYVNAFSFQAVITRNVADRKDSRKSVKVVFPCGIMGAPDGPYISAAIRAAKMVLTIMCEMDSSTCLGCLPSRYYLYGIYSAVFLYKTHMFGSFTAENEHRLLLPLITDFIDALKKAATSKMHPGYRFGKLLECLWLQGTMASFPSSQSGENSSACDSNHPRAPESTTQASDSALEPTMPESPMLPGYLGEEPMGFMSSTSGGSGDFDFLESLFGLNEVNMLPPFGNTYPA
ncbi:hypothetical protein MW887_007121 [Aspergillus wentii]|nr:hypothetical protein MW887_007121 [Aspergillus wentii]